jgi:hypothetical protein
MLGRMSGIGFSTAGRVSFIGEMTDGTHILTSPVDSQLKAFADRHDIPVPQPRTRDTLLSKIRSSYDSIAKKAGETASYPGDWLYESWSESGKIIISLHNFID